MLIEDLLGKNIILGQDQVQTIKEHCSQFLRESAGLPLFKSLPAAYNDFHRVKVRLQKRRDHIAEVFDKAFGDKCANIRQRAIFASSVAPLLKEDTDSFYVFPINGYKFLYSKEVTNSSNNYQAVMATMLEQFEDTSGAIDMVTDLLKYTYSSSNICEGISSDSEIILYGIPYYYAVRSSTCENYSRFLT